MTENQRRSIVGYAGAVVAPRADGTIDGADRMQIAGLYARAASSPPATTLHRYGYHAKRQGPQKRVVLT